MLKKPGVISFEDFIGRDLPEDVFYTNGFFLSETIAQATRAAVPRRLVKFFPSGYNY